ncbi:hypothetical protein NW762_003203 [Fusarium torreyae]|uniref:GPI inositol-deacylase winged helix domain-containing protein n=1 Tax=Fusarium torreyae TaxID=1237075 RepID=A0A9W8SAA8_9HYPO|nr:hypothetical protein NW762_003203 [Fusarium torreyae]
MFLYAKVVLANLLSMDSVEEFEDELHSDKFPDNLEQAYDRIIQRVLKEAKPSRQNSVKKILGWVICSKRPLRWREIQSRFCINADTGTCNKKGLRRDSCKKICGSLVDITDCEIFGDAESEQIINIVHQSASKYLVHNGTVNLLQEHTDMALFCCRYLSSSPLFEEQESDSFRDVVQSGYFGFLDYASTHYLFHVQDSKPVFGFKVAVETALVGLLNSHGIMISNRLCSSAPLDALCKEDQGKLDLAIQDCVATTREVEERRQEEFSRDNRYSTLCGRTRFKCPKIHCTMFSPGFLTQKDRDMHLTTHERPFKCTYTECFAHITGYASQEGLQAHNKAIHPVDSDLKVTFPAGTSKKKWDIFEACKQGNLAEVKRFHFAGDNTSKSKEGTHFTPFSVAAQNGHGHICKFFMDQCMSPYEDDQFREVDWSPMAEAIRQQNDEVIELLLHGGFSLKYEGDKFRFARYIAMAILCDSRGGLEHLLGERSSLEHSEMLVDVATALIRENWRRYRPCGNKEVHTVDATLMKAWFRRAFPHLVHGEGAESSAGPLIKRPDSADYQKCKSILMGSDGFFHRAFKSRCHPLAAFLMEIADKDDLQVTDKAGSTPLHSFARSYCDTSNCENCSIVTKRIIEIDGAASVNKSDNNGYLPAARAIRTSLVKPLQALRILFLHVSNLNHKDPNGNGLLHYATASAAHLRVFLENDGIDLFIRNNKGQSAFSFAVFAYSTTDTDVLKTLIDADRTLAWTADDAKFCLTPLHYTFADSGNFATSDFILNQRIVRPNVTKFLLSIPEVEHVLNAYLGSSVHWHPEEVREFARRENLAEALRAMDRIGFGM